MSLYLTGDEMFYKYPGKQSFSLSAGARTDKTARYWLTLLDRILNTELRKEEGLFPLHGRFLSNTK